MKNLKAIQKHWREEFEEKFGAFAIMGSLGRIYNGAFANEARISKAQDFLDTAIAEAVKEVLEEKEEKYQYFIQMIILGLYSAKLDKQAKFIEEEYKNKFKNSLQDIEEKGKKI